MPRHRPLWQIHLRLDRSEQKIIETLLDKHRAHCAGELARLLLDREADRLSITRPPAGRRQTTRRQTTSRCVAAMDRATLGAVMAARHVRSASEMVRGLIADEARRWMITVPPGSLDLRATYRLRGRIDQRIRRQAMTMLRSGVRGSAIARQLGLTKSYVSKLAKRTELDFGVTERPTPYEFDALLAIATSTAATPAQVTAALRWPVGRVYALLQRLTQRGWLDRSSVNTYAVTNVGSSVLQNEQAIRRGPNP